VTKRFAQILLVATLAVTMLGAADSTKRFNRVGNNLMCVCGCSQALLECNHMGCPDSGPMIAELHNQIDLGTASDSQILSVFAAKYGGTVLAAPIRGGFDIVAWILPLGLLLAATFGTAYVVRAWSSRRRLAAGPEVILPESELNQDLRDKIRRDTEW
jgi:cytochrome c-type biogenesis protein CcmH